MEGSVYKIIEIVGTSKISWEDATKSAIETASKSLEDLRVAEVVKMDVAVENGKVLSIAPLPASATKWSFRLESLCRWSGGRPTSFRDLTLRAAYRAM